MTSNPFASRCKYYIRLEAVLNEKSTEELENILGDIHSKDFGKFYENNKRNLHAEKEAFTIYFKNLLDQKKISQKKLFQEADIPLGYGYKLLSQEKRTKQRDIIIRICYAAECTLLEAQKVLKKYGMQQLYAKISRDALLMILFNERQVNIYEVNEILIKHDLEPLKECGSQE